MLYALAANAAVAMGKGVAGVVTGSSALLAEAAHSVADTANPGLLLVSLSLGERPPDEEHPFGHGKERFFWTLLAAVVVFLAGALFAVGEGVLRLIQSEKQVCRSRSSIRRSPSPSSPRGSRGSARSGKHARSWASPGFLWSGTSGRARTRGSRWSSRRTPLRSQDC